MTDIAYPINKFGFDVIDNPDLITKLIDRPHTRKEDVCPADLLKLSGKFERLQEWTNTDKTTGSILGIFNVLGMELSVIMPKSIAAELKEGQNYRLNYRSPIMCGNISEDALDMAIMIAHQEPMVAGELHSVEYKKSQRPKTGWDSPVLAIV